MNKIWSTLCRPNREQRIIGERGLILNLVLAMSYVGGPATQQLHIGHN